MKPLFVLFLLVFSFSVQGQTITIGDAGDYPTLSATESILEAGDTVLLLDQIFDDGTQFLTNVQGTAGNPIVIMANPGGSPIFRGGTEAIHLVNCRYIELNGITVEQQTGNGINIDDGGDYSTPAAHITIRNCTFRDMAASGNNDLLKLSGLDSFLIENCTFTNGGTGGSGIDMVGCHWGIIQDCEIDNAGVTGIQNKGGTRFITIRRNVLRNMSQRALNLGGSTGLQFFRPPLPDPIEDAYEASDIEVYSNIFINNWAPIAYVGATNVVVRNNTFYSPDNWVLRILQENTNPGFQPCQNNEFSNNIIYQDSDLTEANVGPNTLPETFSFSHNLWYNASSDSWQPQLPVVGAQRIVADPQFTAAASEDFTLQMTSPAIGSGFSFGEPGTDFFGATFADPPSRGAVAGDPVSSTTDITESELSVTIYPNPAVDRVTTQWEFGTAIVRMFDDQGRLLRQYPSAESPLFIFPHDTPPGSYWLQWEALESGTVIMRKLVILGN